MVFMCAKHLGTILMNIVTPNTIVFRKFLKTFSMHDVELSQTGRRITSGDHGETELVDTSGGTNCGVLIQLSHAV